MIRHGEAPFLECSSRGDQRFSAFYARIRCRTGRSIEELYQAAKVFEDGTTGLPIKLAKGRQPVNQADVAALYSALWATYLSENPDLIEALMSASGVSDIFGQPGHVCQATEMWNLRALLLAAN
jgi:hypothetical protein